MEITNVLTFSISKNTDKKHNNSMVDSDNKLSHAPQYRIFRIFLATAAHLSVYN